MGVSLKRGERVNGREVCDLLEGKRETYDRMVRRNDCSDTRVGQRQPGYPYTRPYPNPILVDQKSHQTQIPLTTILRASKMAEPRDVNDGRKYLMQKVAKNHR